MLKAVSDCEKYGIRTGDVYIVDRTVIKPGGMEHRILRRLSDSHKLDVPQELLLSDVFVEVPNDVYEDALRHRMCQTAYQTVTRF